MRLLIFLLLLSLPARADDDGEYYGPYRFEPGTTQTVFSDTAYIRSSPSAGAAAIDSVYAFETLRIVRRLPQLLSLGRKTAPWYEVSFQRAGSSRPGYVWGGALALKAIRHGGARFAAGLLSYPDAGAFSAEDSAAELQYRNTFSIKARAGAAADEVRFNISRGSAYFFEATDSNGVVTDRHWTPARGLPPGAAFLVHFGMSGEACGIPTYSIAAAWTGSRLIPMPLLETNADGGEWIYEEAFVYPSEQGGRPGQLRVKETSTTAVDGSEEMKTEVTWRSYRYDAPSARFVRLPR